MVARTVLRVVASVLLLPVVDGVRWEEVMTKFAEEPMSITPGARPARELFSEEELVAAAAGAGCDSNDWKSSLSVYHNMVEHVYVLTLPRPTVFKNAIDNAKRLLSLGFPPDKLSVFVGLDCKALWGPALVQTAYEWFGHLPQWNSANAERGGPLWSKSMLAVGPSRPELTTSYSACDITVPANHSQGCFSSCCAMSHQAIMVDAFSRKNLSNESRVMILEDDATPAPGMFSYHTLDMMRKLSARDDWNMLKLGECETFTDDERVTVMAADQCATTQTDESHASPYQYLTSVDYGPVKMPRGDLPLVTQLDREDQRTHRSYCSHSYVLTGRVAHHILATHFPAKTNCDNQMTETCMMVPEMDGTCLRLEKNIFSQNHSQDSTLPTSCHPCVAEKEETMEMPRPFLYSVPNTTYLEASDKWEAMRARCAANGMDLCPAHSYCSALGANRSDARTRMTDSWFTLEHDHWSRFMTTFSNWVSASKVWMPVLGENKWVHLQSCEGFDGAAMTNVGLAAADAPYKESLTGAVQVGCCPSLGGASLERWSEIALAERKATAARAERKARLTALEQQPLMPR